jgi:hypothetical protein
MTSPSENDENQKKQAPSSPSFQNQDQPSQSAKGPKISLKDYYLSEYDDHEELSGLASDQNISQFFTPQMAKSWRAFLAFLGGTLAIMAIIIALVYLWVSDHTEEEETKAAKGVADIAMSLTYAQLKNIHPQNQNWSHPEFLRNNLTPILAPNYLSLAEIDSYGQFANCPYMLRIHSSSDLSHFIVIAQPCPSMLQWLIPKASIVVDSRMMEMRKITDLKSLNRLIVNSNNLDGLSSNEISYLVNQGTLIPLASLVSKVENQGLAPPKALSLIRPGAENRIYNAPRYYLLGEEILNHSLDLVGNADGKEVNMLQQELKTLIHFPDLVLYTPGGIQHAVNAQKALTSLMPNEKFLIAYLQLSNHEKITNSHLLIDDHPFDIANVEMKSPLSDPRNELIPEQEMPFAAIEEDRVDSDVDIEDPLYIQLVAMADARCSTLQPIEDEIVELVKKQTLSAQPEFTGRLIKLQQKYADVDREEQNKIFKKFHTLTQDHFFLPAAKFLEFVQAAGLKVLFQDYLSQLKKKSKELHISDEQIELQFQAAQTSSTWQELEQHATQINQLLQFDRVPDEARLIAFQNSARSIVTQKLNQFILSSTEALSTSAFNPEYLQTLTNIIKAAWITDPEMHDFYITEFELRAPEPSSLSSLIRIEGAFAQAECDNTHVLV